MKILFIGHSLIEFFDWQKRFPAHSVVNLGVAGEMVEGLLRRIRSITGKHSSADLIFLMSGLNDVAMEELGFLGSYREVIVRLKTAYPDVRIYINSLLPTAVDFIDNTSIWDVNDSLKKLSAESGAAYLDIYHDFTHPDGSVIREYLLADGVHLSDQGYEVWSGVLEGVIQGLSWHGG